MFVSFLIHYFFGHHDGFLQGSELIVHFLQLALHVALCHNAAARLIIEDIAPADEGAYRNSLVQIAVQPDESDASAVGSAVGMFYLRDELHGPDFRCATQCSCRESLNVRLDGIALR